MADEPNIDITEPTDRWLWVCDVAAEMTDRGLSTSGLEVDTLVAIPHEGKAPYSMTDDELAVAVRHFDRFRSSPNP